MNEFEIIERYFTRPSADASVVLGVGDDAALLAAQGTIAVSVDTLLDGVHFPKGGPPEAFGHRALAVNLSDLAAMGARPRWCTLALTLPQVDADWLEAFAGGFHALADAHGVALVGGNLARGPLNVTVQVIGSFDAGTSALRRSGGHAGDDVWVTGTLGDAAAGLALLEARGAAVMPKQGATAGTDTLIERYYRPQPRIAAGLALAPLATAAIDISDGFAADLAHLVQASACGARIDVEALPRSPALGAAFDAERALAFMLSGGDDYELCFTAPEAARERISAVTAEAGARATRVGRLTRALQIEWLRNGTRFVPSDSGYIHFR